MSDEAPAFEGVVRVGFTTSRTPLAERDEIVRFVAEQVQRDQASSWTFEIRPNEIAFR